MNAEQPVDVRRVRQGAVASSTIWSDLVAQVEACLRFVSPKTRIIIGELVRRKMG
jgi:hypothetical protein